jgi:hypothetical protein
VSVTSLSVAHTHDFRSFVAAHLALGLGIALVVVVRQHAVLELKVPPEPALYELPALSKKACGVGNEGEGCAGRLFTATSQSDDTKKGEDGMMALRAQQGAGPAHRSMTLLLMRPFPREFVLRTPKGPC